MLRLAVRRFCAAVYHDHDRNALGGKQHTKMTKSTATIECERVGLEYFSRAPHAFSAVEVLRASPEQIFAAFADAESWPKWVTPIKSVRWTSEGPVSAESTRTVSMMGGLVADEQFLAYQPNEYMAFRFDRVSQPTIEAFAEEYYVSPLRSGGSQVAWRMAMTPAGPSARTMGPTRPVMNLFLGRTLRQLDKYLANHPG